MLMAMTSSKLSEEMSMKSSSTQIPALLTRMSKLPPAHSTACQKCKGGGNQSVGAVSENSPSAEMETARARDHWTIDRGQARDTR